jgi:3-deoxy-D-manno-octulosonate 8-phosphate phosphatase (KDO 8-P phosphatase)
VERNLLPPTDVDDPKWIDHPSHCDRLRRIEWVISDVDGVLTDGKIIIDAEAGAYKHFCARDGIGFWLAHEAGMKTVLFTGRLTPVVRRRVRELSIHYAVGRSVDKKVEGLFWLQQKTGLDPSTVLYIGDDIIDLPIFPHVGLSVSPFDGDPLVLQRATAITHARGGEGVLREAVEAILRAKDQLDSLIRKHFDQGV